MVPPAVGRVTKAYPMSRAKQELEALWAAVFHEPPAVDAEPRLLAELLLKCSPPPPIYGAEEIEAQRAVTPPDDRCARCGR
jgi:hypothetical protein